MQVIPQGLFDSYYQKAVETGEISLQEQMQFWALQAYCFWFLFRIPIRGEERYAYLNNNQISSTSIYSLRMWICSKLNSYSLHCQTPFFPS